MQDRYRMSTRDPYRYGRCNRTDIAGIWDHYKLISCWIQNPLSSSSVANLPASGMRWVFAFSVRRLVLTWIESGARLPNNNSGNGSDINSDAIAKCTIGQGNTKTPFFSQLVLKELNFISRNAQCISHLSQHTLPCSQAYVIR